MPPIKRHEALAPFSRDHHNGLLLVWKIRQGLKKNIEPSRIVNYLEFAFAGDLEPHFRDEEKWLFPLLENENPGRLRAEADHSRMRGLLEKLREEARPEWLSEFAQALEVHIRFEERELFNEIQSLPQEILAPIEEKFNGHTCATDDDWKDQFWTSDPERNSRDK